MTRSEGGFLRKSSLGRITEDQQHEISAGCRLELTSTAQRTKVIASDFSWTSLKKLLFFASQLLIGMTISSLRCCIFLPLSIAAPSFWLSALLWMFWKIIHFPINLLKWLLRKTGVKKDHTGASRPCGGYSFQRTILISCGSSIQTLHLARNFYLAGVRVIAFEFDDLFGLARFSAAVGKFYLVPRPNAINASNYIDAICQIVRKERPVVYIPVCATNPAYYDALAKPYLELLGCASFIPGIRETMILDDCLQFFEKCSGCNIKLPPHSVLRSKDNLMDLYTNGFIANYSNILIGVGTQGLLERRKYILPKRIWEFKFDHDISERNKWLLVRDLPGDHFVTCTTVKDSRVVANVVCTIEAATKKLVPILTDNANSTKQSNDLFNIEKWISIFFAKVRFQRTINGHFSFRLVRCHSSGHILPLGIRVGVSLPYICNTNDQKPFRTINYHVPKQDGSFTNNSNRECGGFDSKIWPWSVPLKSRNANLSLDKHETLFSFWDPLPYCAFYHFQMPLESVKLFLKKRQK